MKKDELIKKIHNGREGSLDLSFEEVCMLQKMLLNKGYAVLVTGGDVEGEYTIEWLYAGDYQNLDWANGSNVVFSHADYLEMLRLGDYEEDENDELSN